MTALLRKHGLWRLVNGESTRPATDDDKLVQWLKLSDEAAGLIFLYVEDEQTIHLQGIDDNPVEMWKKLESVHMHKASGTRFNAYHDLFNIKKLPNESVQSLMNCVDEAMRRIKGL